MESDHKGKRCSEKISIYFLAHYVNNFCLLFLKFLISVVSTGFVRECFAYLFIGLFVIVPIIVKLQRCIARYNNVMGEIEIEADLYRSISSHDSMTIQLPTNGAYD